MRMRKLAFPVPQAHQGWVSGVCSDRLLIQAADSHRRIVWTAAHLRRIRCPNSDVRLDGAGRSQSSMTKSLKIDDIEQFGHSARNI